MTTGFGQVIPSGKVQVVQNLEGGIVFEIHVREGEVVRADQALLLIDNTRFRSKYGEERARYLGLKAAAARLRAEVEGRAPVFPEDVSKGEPGLVRNERALYEARKAELNSAIEVLNRQVDQRKQNLVELYTRVGQVARSLALANEEMKITEPLVRRGLTSRLEMIRLEREINDVETSLKAAKQAVPRVRAALEEVRRRIDERKALFKTQAMGELNAAEVDLAALSESLASARDRLERTEVRSPVTGTIKKLHVNTVGGVIQPGMDLVEIVPHEDSLLVEARIRPSDIAFVHPGQDARVKITAYEYAVYGSMDARLEHISADTIVDDRGESHYLIRVRTQDTFLDGGGARLPIIPGMIAEVDILTGRKTVLDYLLRPILRARQKALRER